MAGRRTNILLTNANGETIINDFNDGACLNCIVSNNSTGQRTAVCSLDGVKRHLFVQDDTVGKLYICDEKEKTTRNFLTLVNLIMHCRPSLIERYESLDKDVRRATVKEIEAFKHNIVHINSDAINEFYSLISQDYLIKNFSKLHDKISEIICDNPDEAAELMARLVKYNLNIKTELSVVSKLNNPDSKPSFSTGNLRDAVMSSVYTLYPMFRERQVYINVGEYREKFDIDYDALQVAVFYIIENSIKYSQKGSTVNVDFIRGQHVLSIEFTMNSFFIEDEEIPHLFVEGFQGTMARKSGRGGKGIGLYRAKRLADFIEGELKLEAGDYPCRGKDGYLYADNKFIMEIPFRTQIR